MSLATALCIAQICYKKDLSLACFLFLSSISSAMNANNEQTSIPHSKDEKQPKRTNVFAQPHFTSGKVAQPTQKAKARVSSEHQRDDLITDFVTLLEVEEVVITRKDRLCRFGSELVEWIFDTA